MPLCAWPLFLCCRLARPVPVRAFALRAELRLAFAFRRPFVPATLTEPIPNDLFNFTHVRDVTRNNMLCLAIYYLT